jgi:hypothetical protein
MEFTTLFGLYSQTTRLFEMATRAGTFLVSVQLCYYDVRATKPGLSLLAGTVASTTFLFFRITPLIAEQ